jgi:mannose-1-phosphate guanylyltransferase
MYAVILAGGGGTRLWPMSRPEGPKPFLPLLDARSLLQRTVDRIVGHPELPLGPADVTVVVDRRYAALVRSQLPGSRVLSEPMGRNTAAAVALAAIRVERDPDDVMLVLPADHLIGDDAAFRRALGVAARLTDGALGIAAPLVTLGVRPDRPHPGFGYLLPDVTTETRIDGFVAAALKAFEEKPSPERARQLLDEPGTAWNAGVFIWRREALREALERYTALLTLFEPVAASETGLVDAYERVKPLPIDRAVLEGAARDHQVAMVALDAGWSDLGGWTALLRALGASGEGRVVAAGEAAEAGPGDLVIERLEGRLTVSSGPRGILGPNPAALLSGAATSRSVVDALVHRVAAWEERS